MRLLALVGLLAIVAAVAAAGYFFGGYYNVAASQSDPGYVDQAIARVRQASIARHAKGSPLVPLDDRATIQAGAKAFAARGCANCHGGPGVDWAKFSEGLKPGPPDLKEVGPHAEPAQLFWIIKNGIRMTGMPSFGAIEVPDREIWTIVAFLRNLPAVSDSDYKAWTASAAGAGAGGGKP